MKKSTKNVLKISSLMLAVGFVITCIAYFCGGRPGFRIDKNGISPYNERRAPYIMEKTAIDAFDNVDISVSYTDIEIKDSGDDKYYLEYYLDGDSQAPEYSVHNRTLQFCEKSASYVGAFGGVYIGMEGDIDTYQVTLYVPKKQLLNSVTLDNEYGDITLSDTNATSIDFSMDTGDITLDRIAFETINGSCSYGDIELLLAESYKNYSLDLSTDYGSIAIPGQIIEELDECEYVSNVDTNKSIVLYCDIGDITLKEE